MKEIKYSTLKFRVKILKNIYNVVIALLGVLYLYNAAYGSVRLAIYLGIACLVVIAFYWRNAYVINKGSKQEWFPDFGNETRMCFTCQHAYGIVNNSTKYRCSFYTKNCILSKSHYMNSKLDEIGLT